jgi:hypothetical protein
MNHLRQALELKYGRFVAEFSAAKIHFNKSIRFITKITKNILCKTRHKYRREALENKGLGVILWAIVNLCLTSG